ncbi:MAG TPA: bifunctional glutamate N-acetyltransferase/amino-acid acetyltransferase ArgJ [Terriglobales bacterium]|nr:bifunctional glutamate N-acetyltransferase/amino-acid acetyltransferase ArgJ [Terriglobales bacterium]
MSTICPSGKIALPAGFSFATSAAGIKASGRPDLALFVCAPGTRAAALFTKNRVVAAPVQVGRGSLKKARGSLRAVIVNSGNANCATGVEGLHSCQRVCKQTARLLGVTPQEVFPSSTGIIGVHFPVEKVVANLPDLVAKQAASEESVRQFAATIMTTDTRPKIASAVIETGKRKVSLLGIAKGSGMIHPNLATMLVYLFTDAIATPSLLTSFLRQACDETFNCISVDGDTSTNDTVLLAASGQGGIDLHSPRAAKEFGRALAIVSHSLAQQIVSDGEGVTHAVKLTIEQARKREDALRVARAIAHSPLVKTAWAGADPNWGRILSAIGNSGVPIDPNRINIFIGDQQVCRNGCTCPWDEAKAHEHLSRPESEIRVQLGRGSASLRFYTTDLTAEYVRINADYTT